MKSFVTSVLFMLIGSVLVQSQSGGNSTYNFLRLTNSARIAALGGDNISISDGDLNFVFHNPALLSGGMSNNLVLNYVNYFAGINYGYTAYARNFENAGIFAAGLHYINYGKFVKADPSGKITGEFKAFEMAFNISWAKPVFDSLLSVGLSLKPIYSQLESFSSFGLALDAGVNYISPSKLFSASMVIKNAGSQLKPYYEGNYEPLPFDMQVGLSQKLQHAPFRISFLYHHLHKWDLSYNINGNPAFSAIPSTSSGNEQSNYKFADNFFRHTIFSVEFIPSKNFILMLGYNHQRRKELMVPARPFLVGYSWGLYIRISKIRLSFGQAIYHLAGASSHFSLNLNLNDFYSGKK
ncbi:MAG: type IX secretion system protein PorQ [Bacteroidales bacterium]